MSISREELNIFTVSAYPAHSPGQIGQLLVDAGRITQKDAERILHLQRENGMRFGDAARRLGLVSEADIARVLSRQFEFPYLVPGESQLSGELVAAYAPFDPRIEIFRALRSQLLLRCFDPKQCLNYLAVVSPCRHEGRSYVAANLAIVFSQLGERTLLIDADLRNPRQHVLFNLPNRTGLSAMLAGRADMDAIEHIVPLLDLAVLPAGPLPPNPQDLLGRPAFQKLLLDAQKEFDVVILDTPAGEGSADAQTIASRAGGALMVMRKHHTPLRAARALCDRLAGTGTSLVGAVLSPA